MQPVSARWGPALATDHGLATRVNVLYDGALVAEDIPFVDGSISVDRGSDVRRSLSLTIANPADFPTSETALYGVYGQTLYVESGITYLDGSSELVPCGHFVITQVSGNIHTGPLTITATGLEILLKRAVFETATSTRGFANAAAFINTQLQAVIPGVSFVDASSAGSSSLATKTWDAGQEVWPALVEVATSVGAELYCDANGSFRLVDIPDIETAVPVWDVSAGEYGVMVSADMAVTADEVYNRVVVSGENTEDDTPPVSAEAKITTGPLRYGGPFGKVTKAYSSSLITSGSQAYATAIALLRKYQAPNRTVTLSTIPNPALEAGDCIRVDYGDTAPVPAELHLVQSFSVPLSVDGNASFTIETVSGREENE